MNGLFLPNTLLLKHSALLVPCLSEKQGYRAGLWDNVGQQNRLQWWKMVSKQEKGLK